MAAQPKPFGTALVIGGCGFIGYHIVGHLIQDEEFSHIHVLDVNIEKNRHDSASYVPGDITNARFVRLLLDEIQPKVIFHAASPLAVLPASRDGEFYETNVKGTQIVLEAATENKYVRALVYTSTCDAYANPPHKYLDESYPLWSESDTSNEYNRTKAIGDEIVRLANSAQLRTVALRLGHVYGERQSQGMVEALDACSGNKRLVQVGKGDNIMEVVSVTNVAIAHVLAAKALLDAKRAVGKVDGEAFNISDGAPQLFWHHMKVIWTTAKGEEAVSNIMVLPAWVMIVVVYAIEWALWIGTWNTVKPPAALRLLSLQYCLYNHTYNIEKAKERLSFRPISDHDAVLARAARWALENKPAS